MSDSITLDLSKVVYGDFKADASWPASTWTALVREGFVHFMGNRAQSKAVADIKEAIGGSPSREDVSKYREENQDQVTSWITAYQTDQMAAFESGAVTTGSRGPRGSTFDKFLRAAILRRAKHAVSMLGGVWPNGKNPDGTAKTWDHPKRGAMTADDILSYTKGLPDAWHASNFDGETIEDEAKRTYDEHLAEKARVAEKFTGEF